MDTAFASSRSEGCVTGDCFPLFGPSQGSGAEPGGKTSGPRKPHPEMTKRQQPASVKIRSIEYMVAKAPKPIIKPRV